MKEVILICFINTHNLFFNDCKHCKALKKGTHHL